MKYWVVAAKNYYSKQSRNGALYWLRDRACMAYMCVSGLAEDLEARVLKRKLWATHRERRHVPPKTGDGACRYSGGGTVGVERLGSDGKPEAFSLFRAKRSSRKVIKL